MVDGCGVDIKDEAEEDAKLSTVLATSLAKAGFFSASANRTAHSRDFFFFKQKTAYEMIGCDWSSDVCSSDLKTVTLIMPKVK